jgi:hypothetical protein
VIPPIAKRTAEGRDASRSLTELMGQWGRGIDGRSLSLLVHLFMDIPPNMSARE